MKEIIDVGGYTPQQVFNKDAIRTFISTEEKIANGPKASKERLILLLGNNAAGYFKLKPLFVYNSETPRAMKNISKENLPVLRMSNKRRLDDF